MSFPNNFNFHGDNTNNHCSFPNQMNPNSRMVRSMFTTSDHTNHGDLYSPSPFTSFQNSHVSSSSFELQNSHVSSSSFGFHNSHVKNHMMSDNYFSVKNHSQLTQISFTQTTTNRYTAIIPTSALDTIQYGIERDQRAMHSKTDIWNPIFPPPHIFDKHRGILNPEPFDFIFPRQDSAHHLERSFMSSTHNHDQHILQDGRFLKKIWKPSNLYEKTIKHNETEEKDNNDDDPYDGRTHSLPYEKYGPYTCPKCNGVFDTSQKFAAHMSSHYKTETKEEREQRLRAKNKRKYCKLTQESHGKS
ncbi:hypothetical protein CARUB_v10015875mg [Capsella rubella]|uniref:C2H2-type domain-containing protein n=1 Tax=Capsella rubella TaxID=81985 RepID=R0I006_9BRAS|nr:uncharacterized protein LOC17892574 [Capsella rubella]EOA29678.1 hypothetical protein CARUB_v10015875mg [Capsella rubella]